jgi:hypothetical protein
MSLVRNKGAKLMSSEYEYLSCAATAKLVRAALKKAFPGVKFSVRSSTYAGGASMSVKWMDGPTAKQVEGITSAYCGSGFDGMIDLKYSVKSWLMPDGSAAFGKSGGTTGSMGCDSPYNYEAPAPGAKLVHFGADYIFCTRENSVAALTAVTEKVCAQWGFPMPVIEAHNDGSAYIKNGWHITVPNASQDLATLVHREMQCS